MLTRVKLFLYLCIQLLTAREHNVIYEATLCHLAYSLSEYMKYSYIQSLKWNETVKKESRF